MSLRLFGKQKQSSLIFTLFSLLIQTRASISKEICFELWDGETSILGLCEVQGTCFQCPDGHFSHFICHSDEDCFSGEQCNPKRGFCCPANKHAHINGKTNAKVLFMFLKEIIHISKNKTNRSFTYFLIRFAVWAQCGPYYPAIFTCLLQSLPRWFQLG